METTGVYVGLDASAVVATLATLRHYRAFLTSGCRYMRDVYTGATLDKAQAAARLHYLVDVAITRKGVAAGCEPDRETYRKAAPDYQTHLMRDGHRLRDIARRVRVYQFESPECRTRFAHLLTNRD